MSSTARLGIVEVEQAQSQKEVTVNAGFQKVDDAAITFKTYEMEFQWLGFEISSDARVPKILPYAYDGTSRTFVLKRVHYRCESTSSGISLDVSKYTGTGAASPTTMLSAGLTDGAHENTFTSGFTSATCHSGDKVWPSLDNDGPNGMTVLLVFEETL